MGAKTLAPWLAADENKAFTENFKPVGLRYWGLSLNSCIRRLNMNVSVGSWKESNVTIKPLAKGRWNYPVQAQAD